MRSEQCEQARQLGEAGGAAAPSKQLLTPQGFSAHTHFGSKPKNVEFCK